MELSFFLKFYDLGVQSLIVKDGKMETAMLKKLEKSNLVDINTRQGVDRASRTATGKELYKKFNTFRNSYAASKNGGVIDFSKKVATPKKKLKTPVTKTITTMAKKRPTPRRKKTASLASEIKKIQSKILKKPTKAQTKAKRSAAAKKAYKGSKLEAINKSATALQKASGTKQITVPKLSRKEATQRAARLYKKGTF